MRKASLLLSLLVASSLSHAQEHPATQQEQAALEQNMCAETKCQRNLRVVLKQKDGATYTAEIPTKNLTPGQQNVTVQVTLEPEDSTSRSGPVLLEGKL